MGFSSGKSKAKRKAKKAAAAQYIDAIRKAEFGGDPVPEIDQSGKSKLQREYGETGMLGGRERRLAREADEVAQKANAVRGDYNQKLERYNQRKRIADAQLSGNPAAARDDKRVAEIDAELNALKAQQPGRGGMLGQRMRELQADRRLYSAEGFQRAQGYRELGELESTYNDLARMSKEAEGYTLSPEAKAREARASSAIAKPTNGMPTSGNNPFNGLLGQSQNNSILEMAANARPQKASGFDPNDYVKDPNSAAEQIRSKVTQYNGIAEKLKQNLQRKAAGGQVLAASAQQGELAGGELAGTNLDQERFA